MSITSKLRVAETGQDYLVSLPTVRILITLPYLRTSQYAALKMVYQLCAIGERISNSSDLPMLWGE
jgi:hypothetical protein